MSNIQDKLKIIRNHVGSYPDFPKKGVLFRDVFSILQDPETFSLLKDLLVQAAKEIQPPVSCIAALDARGFLFGPLISLELKIPFIPIRKKGKLPGIVVSQSYSLEYGQDTLEMKVDSIDERHKRVLIVDDLLATGGSLGAAIELVKKAGAEVAGCLVIIELEDLKGRDGIPVDVISLLKY